MTNHSSNSLRARDSLMVGMNGGVVPGAPGSGVQRFQLAYGASKNQTVTVKAKSFDDAVDKARDTMDRRYAKLDREPPVGWTFTLVKAYGVATRTRKSK